MAGINKVKCTGKVKWFDSTKGFGFIETENDGDLFVHCTGIPDKDGKIVVLESDQKVVFDITEGKRGPQAINVVLAK